MAAQQPASRNIHKAVVEHVMMRHGVVSTARLKIKVPRPAVRILEQKRRSNVRREDRTREQTEHLGLSPLRALLKLPANLAVHATTVRIRAAERLARGHPEGMLVRHMCGRGVLTSAVRIVEKVETLANLPPERR
eukprot:CAMPEP_0119361580 /NCGR_PEP_ID=MMETSP1334-20130426/8856_1 /TAXON_ID=127549 /ORGANISM="Calcidiscus leptoporus, Strain RCC1130" /LENGTH=134 /DNA_ID=CAMNT_0007376635 /DNA_START=315 /DNA_END=719 /DNA_ORIENTATION=+